MKHIPHTLPVDVKSRLGTQLFQHLPASVAVIDQEFRVVLANGPFARMFGAKTGQYCFEIYKKRNRICDNCQALKTFKDGEVRVVDEQGLDRNGRPTHYVVHMAPLYDDVGNIAYVVEMSYDVTENHELSRKLLRESTLRHTLTENALDALVATDRKGAVRILNPAAETLFSISAADVLDTKEAGRFYPEAFQKTLAQGGSSLAIPEIHVTDTDGTRIPVRFSGTVLRDEKGNVIGGSAFFQDLREIKRLEKEKMERHRLATVGETVAEIAHAIKNILTGLQGGMHKLRTGQCQKSQAKIDRGWEMLDRNFARVTVLVRGLLNLSKRHVPHLRTVNVTEVVDEVCRQFRQAAGEKKISLVCEPPSETVTAHVDPEDLHTCLANLISNAIDACASSEKTDCTVTVRTKRRNDTTVFEIIDTGCGMDNEVLQKAFDVFYSTKGIHGTGLGLAVTRKIVTEHGGTLEVDSTHGRGSTFRIALPHPPQQDRLNDPLPQPTAAGTTAGQMADEPSARRRNDAKKDTGCG